MITPPAFHSNLEETFFFFFTLVTSPKRSWKKPALATRWSAQLAYMRVRTFFVSGHSSEHLQAEAPVFAHADAYTLNSRSQPPNSRVEGFGIRVWGLSLEIMV